MLNSSNINQLLDGTSQRSLSQLLNAIDEDIRITYLNATENTYTINSYTDFGTPSGTTYILEDNKGYFITTEVILPSGYNILCGRNNCIYGVSSESSSLKGNLPSGKALINSNYSLPIRNISFALSGDGNILNLDASSYPNQALDWVSVNILGGRVGLIKGYSNFVGMLLFIAGHKDGFIFDGSVGTIAFSQTLFSTPSQSGCTHIKINSTANVTRRMRFVYSAMVVTSGNFGINFSSGATVPSESFIVDNANFSGSSESNYLNGLNYLDNKALIKETKGITNTASVGQMYMEGNVTTTTITGTTNYTKVLGTTTPNPVNQKFEHSDGRLTCKSAIERTYRLTGTLSLSSGNNNQIYIKVFVNGLESTGARSETTTGGTGRSENVKINWLGVLRENDYVEVWVRNTTSTNNITVSTMDVIIEGKE